MNSREGTTTTTPLNPDMVEGVDGVVFMVAGVEVVVLGEVLVVGPAVIALLLPPPQPPPPG